MGSLTALQAYKYSGDMYATKPGDKPWISEMYGYAYGAAKSNVWHKWDTYSMGYPGFSGWAAYVAPKMIHYGLFFEVDGYKFDKHWHYDFNVTQCPPWENMNQSDPKTRKSGLFPHPPRISALIKVRSCFLASMKFAAMQ